MYVAYFMTPHEIKLAMKNVKMDRKFILVNCSSNFQVAADVTTQLKPPKVLRPNGPCLNHSSHCLEIDLETSEKRPRPPLRARRGSYQKLVSPTK